MSKCSQFCEKTLTLGWGGGGRDIIKLNFTIVFSTNKNIVICNFSFLPTIVILHNRQRYSGRINNLKPRLATLQYIDIRLYKKNTKIYLHVITIYQNNTTIYRHTITMMTYYFDIASHYYYFRILCHTITIIKIHFHIITEYCRILRHIILKYCHIITINVY